MKKLISLLALVLTVCSTAMAEILTAESEVGTVGTLAGREAMVVDLGGTIGKVAIAMENVGATTDNPYGTCFNTTNANDPSVNGLTGGWYVPSKDELTALKGLLSWKNDYSAVYYKELQLPLRAAGQSYYGDYITSTTSENETNTYYAYLYIAYAYNMGEGSGIPSMSINEKPDRSELAIRPFHKLPTKNQYLFYTSSDNSVLTPHNVKAFNACIVSNTYENGKGIIIFSGELTNIGDEAFNSQTTLTSITIPESVTSIGWYAFNGTKITAVTIPAMVTSIGFRAFNECSQLSTLTFAEGSQLETIAGYAFRKTQIATVTIPASVTTIGEYAFNGCTSLSTLSFAEGSQLKTIGIRAFTDTAISGNIDCLPASLEEIGDYAFCELAITAVTIPVSVKNISIYAFCRCSKLASLTFADGSQLESIAESAFSSTAISGDLYFPASLKRIEAYAFTSTQISSTTIPSSIKSMGKEVFGGCNQLRVYMDSEDLSDFENNCFSGCGAVIVVPAMLYEKYKSHFAGDVSYDVTLLNEWQEYAIAHIEAAIKTANTISDTDRNTIATHISTIENATTFDGTLDAYHAALALIDQQKAFEESVKGVFNTIGTKKPGAAIEIVGKDGQTIKLFNIEKVNFINAEE